LLFLSKLLKRVVKAHLQAHLDGSSLLPGWQSAYRRLHSTETAVTKVFNDLLMAVDWRQMSTLCLLDLSSAFDTVDHDFAAATTRASVWLVWHSAPVDSIILVRQDIPCCVWRCAGLHCPRYVLGSARLSPWSAVFFILYMTDMELGHWVTGSMGHLGHLSRPGSPGSSF